MISEIVYSTEYGRMCPGCGKPAAQCVCRKKKHPPAKKGDGQVRVSRETKGRKGKGVAIILGLALGEDKLKELAKELKRTCGCGGTVKQGAIEIQGDHRDKLVEELVKRGFNAKKSGG
jgi:translation initiation factor 1